MKILDTQITPNLNWDKIDTVLLDMDGTLLDLHFDHYFWTEYVVGKYAEKNQVSIKQAYSLYQEQSNATMGGIKWTQTDYWSEVFDLDIITLQSEISHLIQQLPSTRKFLDFLKSHRKKIVLVTNSDDKSLRLKFKHTNIENYFDDIFTSTRAQFAKEEIPYWDYISMELSLDRNKTILIDDNEQVLKTAENLQLNHLLCFAKPNSKREISYSQKYPSIASFDELLISN
ncbi:MAG: HAD hydrolase-like protein [Desulfotalea sp.]